MICHVKTTKSTRQKSMHEFWRTRFHINYKYSLFSICCVCFAAVFFLVQLDANDHEPKVLFQTKQQTCRTKSGSLFFLRTIYVLFGRSVCFRFSLIRIFESIDILLLNMLTFQNCGVTHRTLQSFCCKNVSIFKVVRS